jgi:hypothetical protein
VGAVEALRQSSTRLLSKPVELTCMSVCYQLRRQFVVAVFSGGGESYLSSDVDSTGKLRFVMSRVEEASVGDSDEDSPSPNFSISSSSHQIFTNFLSKASLPFPPLFSD